MHTCTRVASAHLQWETVEGSTPIGFGWFAPQGVLVKLHSPATLRWPFFLMKNSANTNDCQAPGRSACLAALADEAPGRQAGSRHSLIPPSSGGSRKPPFQGKIWGFERHRRPQQLPSLGLSLPLSRLLDPCLQPPFSMLPPSEMLFLNPIQKCYTFRKCISSPSWARSTNLHSSLSPWT